MSVHCILFDLFGTLVDYDAGRVSQNYVNTHGFVRSLGIDVGYDEFLEHTQIVFAELDAWSLKTELEFSMHVFAEALFESLLKVHMLSETERDASKYLDEFVDRYTKDWSAPIVPVENVQTFLRRCQKQFITGLITNTHHEPLVTLLIDRFALDGFKVVTTSVEHGRPKPHTSIFLDTLEKLHIPPENAVYVGDTFSADYIGATNAGLQCYLIGKHARVPREFQIPTVLDLPIHLF